MLVVHVKTKEPLETHIKSHVGEPFIMQKYFAIYLNIIMLDEKPFFSDVSDHNDHEVVSLKNVIT